jgi:6-phosphofructokinase 1
MTTGGDCSGLNSVIRNLTIMGLKRKHQIIGILDGTDGLTRAGAPHFVEFDHNTLPIENMRLSGSWLQNGHSHAMNFQTAAKSGEIKAFNARMKKSLAELKIDALVIVGGNGTLSIAGQSHAIYGNIQVVGIPKTIDLDIPLTDRTIGFETAVQQLTSFCDQLLLTARSHHRWFVVQSMGRDVGALALHAGVACGADAILIPEIKFKPENLIKHINKIHKEQGRNYGIIMVSEGIKMRGHSGRPGDMIARELNKADIPNRTAFPEHTQRTGDTAARDRILAARFAECALDAIENNETYVMTRLHNGIVDTVSISDMFKSGEIAPDPNIPNVFVSNEFVSDDDPLLSVAVANGTYVGELK